MPRWRDKGPEDETIVLQPHRPIDTHGFSPYTVEQPPTTQHSDHHCYTVRCVTRWRHAIGGSHAQPSCCDCIQNQWYQCPYATQSGALLGDVTQLVEVMPNPHAATVSETSDISAHSRTQPTFGCTNCARLPPPPPSYAPLFILWWTSKKFTLLISLPFQREK
jgi:hypothetical protein